MWRLADTCPCEGTSRINGCQVRKIDVYKNQPKTSRIQIMAQMTHQQSENYLAI